MDDADPLAKASISKLGFGEELVCDGATFQWWAVGGCPALVTVHSPLLGSLTDFTVGDVKEFAMLLARKLLNAETEQMPAVSAQPAEDSESLTSSLKKHGWSQ